MPTDPPIADALDPDALDGDGPIELRLDAGAAFPEYDPAALDLEAELIEAERLHAQDDPAPAPRPPLTAGQLALRGAAALSGLGFVGSLLTGALNLGLLAMVTGMAVLAAWITHEPLAQFRLGRRQRRRIGDDLIARGFSRADKAAWRRDGVTLRWQGFVDPHVGSLAPAALAGKIETPPSWIELRAPLGDGLPANAGLAPADRSGLGVEWADHLVTTGDAAFDDRFSLEGPPRPLLALLDAELRGLLLDLDDGGGAVEIADGLLVLRAQCVDGAGESVERFADLLRRIGARLGEPVEARLRRQLLAHRARGPVLHRLLPCLDDLDHRAVAGLLDASAARWPWLAVVRATRIGGAPLREAVADALTRDPRNAPWIVVEPALRRLLTDATLAAPDQAAPLAGLDLARLSPTVFQPLIRLALAHRPAGDATVVRLLRPRDALAIYLDDGGDPAALDVLAEHHQPGDDAIEQALRQVAQFPVDHLALPAVAALGRIGDARTAAWLDRQLEDARRSGIISRQDGLAAGIRSIRHRARRTRDARAETLGGGLAMAAGAATDGRLSPAAGGELTVAADGGVGETADDGADGGRGR